MPTIGIPDIFTAIEMQKAEIEENNHKPQILVIYRPVLDTIRLDFLGYNQALTFNPETNETTLMGLKVVPVNYLIENFVKVY